MKVNKTISLDPSTAKRLEKEKNYSQLINRLLKQHFATPNSTLQDRIREAVKNVVE